MRTFSFAFGALSFFAITVVAFAAKESDIKLSKKQSPAHQITLKIDACPKVYKKKQRTRVTDLTACETLILEDLKVSFTPGKKEVVFHQKVLRGLNFTLLGRKSNGWLKRGQAQPDTNLSLMAMKVTRQKNQGSPQPLHYSEQVFFEDKTHNYLYMPIQAANQKTQYFVEIRQSE